VKESLRAFIDTWLADGRAAGRTRIFIVKLWTGHAFDTVLMRMG